MTLFVGAAPIGDPGSIYTPPVAGGDGTAAPSVTVESAATTINGLNSDIAAAADGSVIGLVASSTLTGGASDQVRMIGRNGIQIVGRGATIHRTAAGTTPFFQVDGGGSNFGLFNMTINGSKSSSLGKWDVTYEHEHGIQLGGIVNAEFSGVSITNVGGDGCNFLGSVGADSWSKNVRFHHGVLYNCGRMGISITDGARSVVVDFNTISQIGYYTFDIEPNGYTIEGISAGALDVRFSDNTIGTKPYGDYPSDATQALGYLFAATGSSGAGPAKRIQILRNTMSAGNMRIYAFHNGVTCEDWDIESNVIASSFTATADILKCVKLDTVAGVTVINNTQPCTVDADFVSTPSCTGTITTTPNTI